MKLFRRFRRRLSKELPPCLPTRVVFRPRLSVDADAHTAFQEDRILIRIDERIRKDEHFCCDCLAHEWGHAVVGYRREHHDPAWGIAYAAAWRILDSMLGKA